MGAVVLALARLTRPVREKLKPPAESNREGFWQQIYGLTEPEQIQGSPFLCGSDKVL